MTGEAFMLLSLKDSKAKRLAQVMGNDTSRKILDYLAHKEGTETAISEALGIPLSTVHYNLKQLVDNNLVLAEEFHYSERGREVIHYKLANKLIIIAPKDADESSIMASLKSILPISAIVLAGTGLVSYLTGSKSFMASSAMRTAPELLTAPAANKVAPAIAQESARVAAEQAGPITGAFADQAAPAVGALAEQAGDVAVDFVAEEAAQAAVPAVEQIPTAVQTAISEPNLALWFFFGAIFALVSVYLIFLLRGKFRK